MNPVLLAMMTHAHDRAAAEAWQASVEYWQWWFGFWGINHMGWVKWEH